METPPLTPDMIRSFREAFQADFGREITVAESEEMASRVLRVTLLVADTLDRKKHLSQSPASTKFESPVVSAELPHSKNSRNEQLRFI